MTHEIIIIIGFIECLIRLARAANNTELVNALETLKSNVNALDQVIQGATNEMPEAHELLETVQNFTGSNCDAENITGILEQIQEFNQQIEVYL